PAYIVVAHVRPLQDGQFPRLDRGPAGVTPEHRRPAGQVQGDLIGLGRADRSHRVPQRGRQLAEDGGGRGQARIVAQLARRARWTPDTARTSDRGTRCVPLTVTERTTSRGELNRTQAAAPITLTAARAKKAARQPRRLCPALTPEVGPSPAVSSWTAVPSAMN